MTRLGVLALFSGHYLLLAFLAGLGVIQMGAARSGRRRLWILSHRRVTHLLGVALLLGGIALFYLLPLITTGPWGPPDATTGEPTFARATWETLPSARNINDTQGGLAGHWQALWFSVGWILAAFAARAVGGRRERRRGPAARASGPSDLVGVGSR